MLNLLSLLVGAAAFIMMLVAFVPLLGWLNWLVIPFAAVGLALGAMSNSNAGRNLCIVVVVIGALRLSLGGGIF